METEVDGTKKLKADATCPKCHSAAHHVSREYENERVKCQYYPCACIIWLSAYEADILRREQEM